MTQPELGEGWTLVESHPFVGMEVTLDWDGESIEGRVATIWEFQGEPRRVDVDVVGEDRTINIDRGADKLEVGA